MRAAALRLSLALLAVTAIATACGTDTATRGRGGSGGGGGGGGGGGTDTGTGGSDTGTTTDTGGDTTPVDCHDELTSGPAGGDICFSCTSDACATEVAAAYGAGFPTVIGGACEPLYNCLLACPCDTADPSEIAADCAIGCVTTTPPACQTATQALQGCQEDSCATECAEPVSTCGDNVVDPDEDCDGTAPACTELGFDGGTAFCSFDCTIDTSGCTNTSESCGNGVVDIGEACDGNNLQGSGCTNFGYTGGTLSCTDVCDLNFSNCTETTPNVCGDGEIAGSEQCDGNNLGGESCTTLGYTSGTLRCSGCAFNVSSCVADGPVCGNGIIEAGETCDGSNVNGIDCFDFGATAGTVRCTTDCLNYDSSDCTADAVCGDSVINGSETCDGFDFGGDSCANQGFVSGSLSCFSDCTVDNSGCSNTPVNLCDPFNATTLRTPATRNDSFTGGEPTDGPRGGSFYKVYSMSLTAGRSVSITMSSVDFDSYLFLYGGSGCSQVSEDDDTAGSRNALITFVPSATGIHYLIATTYGTGVTGTYTLTTN
jgi:hypothetical protein